MSDESPIPPTGERYCFGWPTTAWTSRTGSSRPSASTPAARCPASPMLISPQHIAHSWRCSTRCARSAGNSTLAAIERRLFEIESAQQFPQHFVVDVAVVTFFDERRALGGQHLQSQPAKRRRRALADLGCVAAQPLPRRV